MKCSEEIEREGNAESSRAGEDRQGKRGEENEPLTKMSNEYDALFLADVL